MITIDAVRQYFMYELENDNFTEDRNGGKTIEMLYIVVIKNHLQHGK